MSTTARLILASESPRRRELLSTVGVPFRVIPSGVDETPRRAFDTVYHPSIIQPTLLYWQRTGDPKLTNLFGEWLKVWIDATARAENGKPAGILPSSLAWPAGTVGAPRVASAQAPLFSRTFTQSTS